MADTDKQSLRDRLYMQAVKQGARVMQMSPMLDPGWDATLNPRPEADADVTPMNAPLSNYPDAYPNGQGRYLAPPDTDLTLPPYTPPVRDGVPDLFIPAEPLGTRPDPLDWVPQTIPNIQENNRFDVQASSDPIAAMRNALIPDPNSGYVLPLARDPKTGNLVPAVPGMARDFSTGLLDLAQGARTGTVSPQGSMTLLQMLLGGGMPNKLIPRQLYSRELGMSWPPNETRPPGAPYSPNFKWSGTTGLEVPKPETRAVIEDEVLHSAERFFTHPDGQIEPITRLPGVEFSPDGVLSKVRRADGTIDWMPDKQLMGKPTPIVIPDQVTTYDPGRAMPNDAPGQLQLPAPSPPTITPDGTAVPYEPTYLRNPSSIINLPPNTGPKT